MNRAKEAVRIFGCWGGLSICLMVLMEATAGTTILSVLSSGLLGAAATIWAFSDGGR